MQSQLKAGCEAASEQVLREACLRLLRHEVLEGSLRRLLQVLKCAAQRAPRDDTQLPWDAWNEKVDQLLAEYGLQSPPEPA